MVSAFGRSLHLRHAFGRVELLLSVVVLMGGAVMATEAKGAVPDRTLTLWQGRAPLAKGAAPADVPAIDVYLPGNNPTHTGVIVIPGGGYKYLAEHEGAPIAEWLRAHGVAVFVLHYRVSPYQFPAEMLDGQRAVRLVRSRAEEFGISASKLGVWGFSAGGHLASYLMTHGEGHLSMESVDAVDAVSARPDFGALAYPVISMKQDVTHRGSHESLLGEAPSAEREDELSSQLHVTEDCPPLFLFSTTDDQIVPVENSILFYEAYVRNHLPVEMHLFEHGVHGTGLAQNVPGASAWPSLLADWMQRHGWMAQ